MFGIDGWQRMNWYNRGKDMIVARPDNTVFVTICDYPNPGEVSEPLLRTAKHFGIPVHFASYGQQFNCLFEKYPKILNFLKELPETIKFMIFVDCRDTVFADTFERILAAVNSTYTGGMLIQAGNAGLVRQYVSRGLILKMGSQYPYNGYACSGCYCGAVSEVILVLKRAMELRSNIDVKNYKDELAAMYLNDPESHKSIHKLNEHDEFMFQLLQLTDSRINLDTDKRVSALFGNSRPNAGKTSVPERMKLPVDDIAAIGSACILHSPAISRNRSAWSEWIDGEIIGREKASFHSISGVSRDD